MGHLLYVVLRILMGLYLLMIAAMNFGFMPGLQEDTFNPEEWAFLQALMDSGYIWPIIGAVCGLSGIALLLNRYVQLTAIVLMPITLNFALFHFFYEENIYNPGAAPAYALFALNIYLLIMCKERYEDILKP